MKWFLVALLIAATAAMFVVPTVNEAVTVTVETVDNPAPGCPDLVIGAEPMFKYVIDAVTGERVLVPVSAHGPEITTGPNGELVVP